MSWFQAPAPLVPDLIAQNGRWLADRPALIDGEVTLSWREVATAVARSRMVSRSWALDRASVSRC
jgi:hypothetical protein